MKTTRKILTYVLPFVAFFGLIALADLIEAVFNLLSINPSLLIIYHIELIMFFAGSSAFVITGYLVAPSESKRRATKTLLIIICSMNTIMIMGKITEIKNLGDFVNNLWVIKCVADIISAIITYSVLLRKIKKAARSSSPV
jgi:hypothetical protein